MWCYCFDKERRLLEERIAGCVRPWMKAEGKWAAAD